GVTGFGGSLLLGVPPLARPEEAAERVAQYPRRIGLVACPLMHGTGLFSALMTLLAGGAVALLPNRHFDAEELWDEVARHRVTSIAIVGLPFAQPMLEALQRHPGRWDISCVTSIGSSGAMWSQENKHALLRFLPQAMLTDAFSSSEAVGMGLSVSTAAGESQTAAFV